MKWIIFIFRIGLGAVFLYAGFIKVNASQVFTIAILPFTIFPSTWARGLTMALVWSEVLAGICMFIPRLYMLGAALIFALCSVFIVFLTWALANGIVVSCDCFGVDETPSAFKMILAVGRDVFLATAAGFVLLKGRIQ